MLHDLQTIHDTLVKEEASLEKAKMKFCKVQQFVLAREVFEAQKQLRIVIGQVEAILKEVQQAQPEGGDGIVPGDAETSSA